MSVALSNQLREGTKKAHTMAENTGFVSCFLKGVVDKKSYRKLVADLFFVYSAMEEEIDRLSKAGHPIVSKISYPELKRRESLQKDLEFYYGKDYLSGLNPSASAKAYVDRIHLVAKETPELLISHHYTRYIGDLSGGQMLSTIAQKAMNLSDNKGLHFYQFDQITDQKDFKDKYKNNLDSLPIDQSMADLIVDESNKAYQYNMKIFKELEGNLIAAIGIVLFRFLSKRKVKGSTE